MGGSTPPPGPHTGLPGTVDKVTLGGACGEAILTSLNLMDAVITLQPYRLGALLIFDGVGGAAPAISAAAGLGERRPPWLVKTELNYWTNKEIQRWCLAKSDYRFCPYVRIIYR